MKKEIADKWAAALRSGDYKQHRGGLANEKRAKHCCLGVLCEVAIKDGMEMQVGPCRDKARGTYYDEAAGSLPVLVQEWAGMETSHGRMADGNSLTSFNDAMQKDFEFIADIIELRWEEL